MTQTTEPETFAVFGHPQYYEVPKGIAPDAFDNPHKHALWDLALGATLVVSATDRVFGHNAEQMFRVSLNVSDTVKANGVMLRSATEAQVANFAHNLLRTIGSGAHELAANLREALASHEQLVERRAQSIAEQVVEPLRQILTAQIQQGEESRVAEARQFSDVEDQLRTRLKALAADLAASRVEVAYLNALLANHGHDPIECGCEQTPVVPAQTAQSGPPTKFTTHRVNEVWDASEARLRELAEQRRESADAVLKPFQTNNTAGDVQ